MSTEEKVLKTLEAKIKKGKPHLKDSSIQQYIRTIKKLNKLINGEDSTIENLDFIEEPEKIKQALEHLHFTTRRNYYTAIINVLQLDETPEINENWDDEEEKKIHYDKFIYKGKLINRYIKIVKEANAQYEEEQEKQIISEKQKKSFLTEENFPVIQEFIDKVKASTDENKDMLYILLRLITKYHTRNEISNLKLIKLMDYKKLKYEDKTSNYLVMGSKKILLVRYDFKTNKKYKEIINEIDDKKLAKEIRTYVKTLKSDNVFEYRGEQLTPKKLTNLLLYQSKKLVGVPLSTTMLAKSILSEKYSPNLKAQTEDAKNRGHSVNVQNKVYVKFKE